jgi:dihydroorotate dehydrogenase electron transfer subunit
MEELMSKLLNDKILDVAQLAPTIYKMTLQSEYLSQNALPGQFVNIKCSEGINALLRRPISICNVDRRGMSYDIVFQIKGTGTELLSKKQRNETVDVLGPLGNSFNMDEKYKRIAVVGGGIGVFPLLFLLKESKAVEKHAYLGFRNADFVVLEDNFCRASTDLNISTDDGSKGYKGLVTDLLEKDIQSSAFDIIYACGPMPMIRQVMSLSEKYSIPCQVSMEQRMGCGIGACLVCACKTKQGDDWRYSHVCKDGPVFWSGDLILEE